MMNYHRRLVKQIDGDSYQPARSYEPAVILSSPTVLITKLSPTVLIIPAVIKMLMIGQSVVVMARDIATVRINYHTCFLCRGVTP